MDGVIIRLSDLSVQFNGMIVLHKINLSIRRGEQWAIMGASGSGKTSLARALAGKLFFSGSVDFAPEIARHPRPVQLAEQQHQFRNLSNTQNFYYQQRFNSSDAEDSVTAGQYLEKYRTDQPEETKAIIAQLQLDALLSKPLIQLSNGENKRLQLAGILLKKPAILILDNPFPGLDKDGRNTLQEILHSIIAGGIHILLITQPVDLSTDITHVAILKEGKLVYCGPRQDYNPAIMNKEQEAVTTWEQWNDVLPSVVMDFETVIRMKNVSVKYGNNLILDAVNWEVKRGERWSVSGPNGAGKSTLLSLVNADNPQAYANEIYLFDRRRGSGESIWDIKRRIGYVSPELHLFFDRSNTGFEVVASGLFDTIGLFRQLHTNHVEQVSKLLTLFNLNTLKEKRFFQLSLGQQRMLLLVRAMVKNPPLLILDEPCQGLDEEQSANTRKLIDLFCEGNERSLIYVSHYEKDIPSCVTKFLRLTHYRMTDP